MEAFALGLVEHGGKKAHLELEGENVGAAGPAFAAFGDDFLDEQATDGQIERADGDEGV
jgi:hypothetical protein